MIDLNESGLEVNKEIGLQDFSRGFVESARLYVENKDIRSDSGIAIVVGLISAFPEKINYQSFNNSREFHWLCATGHVAILINDYIDLQEVLSKPAGKALKERIEHGWRNTLEGIGFNHNLPEEKKTVLKSYMAGITLLDDYVKSHQSDSGSEIIKIKEIENAISVVHCAAMVLSPEEIGQNCLNLYEDLTQKSLEDKFEWMISGKPQNEVQRRLCALYNLVMLTQMVDDHHDYELDDKLKIRNIYSMVLREQNGNQEQAKKKYSEIKNQYQDSAQKLGVSKIAAQGNMIFLDIYKRMQYMFPDKYGGYRERLVK